MVSINISLRKEAYEFLKSRKSPNKSFSEIILDFKKEEKDPLEFFGVLRDLEWKNKEERMKLLRKSFAKRLR